MGARSSRQADMGARSSRQGISRAALGANGSRRESAAGVSRRLALPRATVVRAGPGGAPLVLRGVGVEAVCEEWAVEEAWWTGKPLRRRYFELVLADGRNVVVFYDLESGRWFEQRA